MSATPRPLLHRLPPDAGVSMGAICTLQDVEIPPRYAGLPGELPLAAAVTEALLEGGGGGQDIDRILYAGSIPLHVPHMGAFALAEAVGLRPGHVLDLGNHCAAIPDALWLAMTLYNRERNLLVAPTQLGRGVSEEMRATKPGSLQWCDGAAAVLLGGDGAHHLRPLAYVTATDPTLQSMLRICPREVGYEYDFRQEVAGRFQAEDLQTELALIGEALRAADLGPGALDGVVVVNRGRRRTEMLAPAFGVDPELIVSSRKEIGHGGGADFFFNLRRWMRARGGGVHTVLVVGNGLGYAWSALLMEVRVGEQGGG